MARGQRNHSFKRGGHRGGNRGGGNRSEGRNFDRSSHKQRVERPVVSDLERMEKTKELENAVAITEYVGTSFGFTGVLKARCVFYL